MKKFRSVMALALVLASFLGVVSLTGCEKPLSGKVIATVTTGKNKQNITAVSELANAVDPSGNSVIKFWKDVQTPDPIRLPYSCTIELNGYHISTNPEHGNGLVILATGSENGVTTLKNGTLTHYGIGLEVQAGGIVVDGVTFYSYSGAPICIMDPNPEYRSINVVRNSNLYGGTSAGIIFSRNEVDYSGAGILLENTVVVCPNQDGAFAFQTRGVGGTVELGQNVDIYSYANTVAEEGFYFSGLVAPKDTEPQTMEIGETSYSGMNRWSTGNENKAVNLLMIGNSFCYYFVDELYGIGQAAGVDINVTNLYEAGCRIDEHWTWLNDKTAGADKYEFWLTNSMGRYRHGDIRTSYEALAYLDWQQISVQQHFTIGKTKSYEAAIESCIPHAKNVYDYIKNSNPNAQLYWQAHWAFGVGHDTVPDVATQTRQYINARAASVTVCEENGVAMIPTGDAWQLARADSMIGDTLCKNDNSHDGTTGGGQYLNACVWFEVLTGKSCIGNTWRPETYNLSEEKVVALQQYAHEAVAAVYGADYAK